MRLTWRASSGLAHPRPMHQNMAEYLVVSTKEYFPAGIDPDGVKWAPNRPTTLARKEGIPRVCGMNRQGCQGSSPFLGFPAHAGDESTNALCTA